jgi:hypothetical protein
MDLSAIIVDQLVSIKEGVNKESFLLSYFFKGILLLIAFMATAIGSGLVITDIIDCDGDFSYATADSYCLRHSYTTPMTNTLHPGVGQVQVNSEIPEVKVFQKYYFLHSLIVSLCLVVLYLPRAAVHHVKGNSLEAFCAHYHSMKRDLTGSPKDRIETLASSVYEHLKGQTKCHFNRFIIITLYELLLMVIIVSELWFLDHTFNHAFLNHLSGILEDTTGASLPEFGEITLNFFLFTQPRKSLFPFYTAEKKLFQKPRVYKWYDMAEKRIFLVHSLITWTNSTSYIHYRPIPNPDSNKL